MKQYIDKDVLAAEIEKLKGQLLYGSCSSQISMQTYCKEEAYNEVLSCLDTLEVKEVDLKKEYDNYIESVGELNKDVLISLSMHFFELGLKASNPLTWEDIKLICDIAFEVACRFQRNMKGSLIYKEQHYQEVLKRFKAQKGE